MNRRMLDRTLRKELLLLQAAQYRQRLTEDLRVLVPGAASADEAAAGSTLLAGTRWLVSVLPSGRWRKWLVYGLTIGRVALALSRTMPR